LLPASRIFQVARQPARQSYHDNSCEPAANLDFSRTGLMRDCASGCRHCFRNRERTGVPRGQRAWGGRCDRAIESLSPGPQLFGGKSTITNLKPKIPVCCA
jgi:hypothetical protein